MIGQQLAERYEILDEVAVGGMGVVYRAHDPRLDRQVAVKMIPPSRLDKKSLERFQREAQLVAQMDHPAIVPIHDFGRHGDSLFYVMPLLEGTPLGWLIDGGELDQHDAVLIAIQVAEALAHSHSRAVIHRDVKPENIMVMREGGKPRARVMDFGLAVDIHDKSLTETSMLGTPFYLSPEQIEGRDLDGRTDLYALGTVLYECLAGRPPFEGPFAALLYRIGHEPPPPLAQHGVEVDAELERLVSWCLAKDPSQRPSSAQEVAEVLRACEKKIFGAAPTPGLLVIEGQSNALPSPGARLPLVGRRREWEQLRTVFYDALEGDCQLTLVGGEAGVGKTRLVQEIESLARGQGIAVLKGRFSDLEGSFPHEGLCGVLQDYFRLRESSSSGMATSSSRSAESAAAPDAPWTPDFSDLAPELLKLFPVLSEVGELRRASPSEPRPERADPGTRDSTYVFELFARALIRMADGRPLVLILEHLHTAAASIEAFRYLVHRLAPMPILILGTYRSAQLARGHPLKRLIRSLAGQPRFSICHLQPFTVAELRQLIELMVGSPNLREDAVERIYDVTEGNALFARQLLGSLLETGSLAPGADDGWTLTGEAILTAQALPVTLQQAVERRLERLARQPRKLLETAALLGRSFDVRDLGALVGQAETELDDAIDQLEEQGFLREDEKSRGYRLIFASNLVRQVLYRALPRRRRRLLHRRFAEHLEQKAGAGAERFYPLLVHHFSEGDVADKTVEYALAQARRALVTWSPEDAVRAVRLALEFVDDEEIEDAERKRGHLRETLARAYRAQGQSARALEQAARAVEAFERAGAASQAADAAWLATHAAWQGRLIDETRRWVDRTVEIARGALARDVLHRTLMLGSSVASLQGDPDLARRYREEARALGHDEGSPALTAPVDAAPGGTLIAALPLTPTPLDPAELASDEQAEVVMLVFETLLDFDAEGNLVPGLAADWQSSADSRRFEVVLRDDVLFSDGTLLDAAAVAASLERVARRQADTPPQALAAVTGIEAFLAGSTPSISGLEAVEEPPRLVFELHEPLPIFAALLVDPLTAVAYEREDGTVAGTGPFRLASQATDRVVLERNPRFSGAPAIVDDIEFRTALTAPEIATGLRRGEIDLGRGLLPGDLDELLRDPRFRSGLVENVRKDVHFLLFNEASPAGCCVPLHRALTGVIDRADLVWRTLGRFAQPATGLIPPGLLGHEPGRRHRVLPLEEAHRLLEESGLELPLTLRAAVSPMMLDFARPFLRALLEIWSRLGVEITWEERGIEAFLETYRDNHGLDLLLGRWTGHDDPDAFTFALFHSRHGLLRSYFSSPTADRYLEDARYETAVTERQALYQKFEGLLEGEGIFLPLFHDVAYRLAGPRVRGLRLGSTLPYVNYATLGKTTQDETAAPTALWETSGEVHAPVISPITSYDPVAGAFAEHLEVVSTIFEGLTRLDQNLEIVPWLARSVETERDRRVYRVRLRDDVHFHDGRRLTARDVRYSFERALRDPEGGSLFVHLRIRGARALRAGEQEGLEGVRVHGPHELTLELEEPIAFLPALLAHPAAGIVAEGSADFTANWRGGVAGTGPFRVLSFEKNVRLELERHPQYWRPGYPRTNRLTFHLGQTPERVAVGFREGRFSLASDLRPADVEVLRRDPEFAAGCMESSRLSTLFLALNSVRGPLRETRLRQTLVARLDLDYFFRQAAGHQLRRAHGLLPPGLLGFAEPRRKRSVPAGAFPLHGLELEVAVIDHYIGPYMELWEALLRRFEDLKIEVKIRRIAITELVDVLRTGDVDLVCLRWLADYPDPDSFVSGLLHSREGVLTGLCRSPELDDLCERGRREADPALRQSIYRELEDVLAREALLMPLLHEQGYRFHHPSIAGLQVYFALPEVRYEELSFRD